MQSLWGTRGRPETNAYADACAEQSIRREAAKVSSLRVVEVIKPTAPPKPLESRRTTDKWAAARARQGGQS